MSDWNLLVILSFFFFYSERKQHELNLLTQINEAKTNVADSQRKIADLTYKISELERDLTVKSWNIDRKSERKT